MNVFDLAAKISLDTSEYNKSLDDASKDTGSFASKLKGGLSTAAKVGASAVAAVATTAVAAGKALYSQASATAQYGDNVDKMSQKIGISAEAYQKWDYVMNLAGTSVDNLQTGMKTLSSVIVDAQNGTESAVQKFEAVGISLDELNGLSQEDALLLVVNRLQQMGPSAKRTAAATDLLGRSATDMAALLNMTAEETNAAMQEAEDYGMVLGNDAVKDAAAFQDGLTKLSSTFTGLKNSIFSQFMPGVTSIITGFADLIAGNDNAVQSLTQGFTDILTKLLENVPQILEVVKNVFSAVLETIVQNLPMIVQTAATIMITMANELINQLPLIIEAAYEILISLIEGITEALPDLISTIIDVVLQIVQTLTNPDSLSRLLDAGLTLIEALITGLIDAIPTILDALPEIILNIVNFLLESIPKIIETGIQLIGALADAAPDIIAKIVEMLPTIIDGIINAILNNIGKIIEAGIQLFVSLISNTPKIIAGIVQHIPDIIDGIIKGFSSLFGNMWEIGKSIVDGIWKGISQAATGLWENIKDWAGGLWDGIKNFFGIHSPSKKMQWIGEMMIDGLSTSIDKNGDEAVRSAELLSSKVNNAFSGLGEDINTPFATADLGSFGALNQAQSYQPNNDYFNVNNGQQERDLTIILELDKTQLAKTVYKLNRDETQRIGLRLSNA